MPPYPGKYLPHCPGNVVRAAEGLYKRVYRNLDFLLRRVNSFQPIILNGLNETKGTVMQNPHIKSRQLCGLRLFISIYNYRRTKQRCFRFVNPLGILPEGPENSVVPAGHWCKCRVPDIRPCPSSACGYWAEYLSGSPVSRFWHRS